MDTIQMTRQLGKTLQQDERYIRLRVAQQNNEQDEALQNMIRRFNEDRERLNAETAKPERDQEKIGEMNTGIRDLYAQIFQNENMIEFTKARDELQELLQFINQIVMGSAEGHDPELIEFESGCGGNCDGCTSCD